MRIRDAMSLEFTVISSRTPLRKAAQLMRDGGYGYLPVGDDDRLLGAVTDRDLVVRGIAEGLSPDTPVSQVLSHDIIYCFDDADISEAADMMQRNQIRRLAILNRAKRLVGVLSLGDIARASDDRHLTGRIELAVAQPA